MTHANKTHAGMGLVITIMAHIIRSVSGGMLCVMCCSDVPPYDSPIILYQLLHHDRRVERKKDVSRYRSSPVVGSRCLDTRVLQSMAICVHVSPCVHPGKLDCEGERLFLSNPLCVVTFHSI